MPLGESLLMERNPERVVLGLALQAPLARVSPDLEGVVASRAELAFLGHLRSPLPPTHGRVFLAAPADCTLGQRRKQTAIDLGPKSFFRSRRTSGPGRDVDTDVILAIPGAAEAPCVLCPFGWGDATDATDEQGWPGVLHVLHPLHGGTQPRDRRPTPPRSPHADTRAG